MVVTNATRNKLLLLALISAWFYIIPLLYQFIFVNTDNPQKVITKIQSTLRKQEKEFASIIADKKQLIALYNNTYTAADIIRLEQLPFSFQLYNAFADSTFELRFWNNNTILPAISDLLQGDGSMIIKRENGYHQLVKQSIMMGDTKIIATALLPIYATYFIETDYLKPNFTANEDFAKKYTLGTEPTIYPITNGNGSTILYLNKITDARNLGYSWVYILCRICCFLFLLALFYQLSYIVVQKRQFSVGFVLLAIVHCYYYACICIK